MSAIVTSPYAPLCSNHALRSHSGLPQVVGSRKKKKKRKFTINLKLKPSNSIAVNKKVSTIVAFYNIICMSAFSSSFQKFQAP